MAEIFGSTTTTPINPDAFSGGGTVDQTYNPESENAQSGIAVNEAIKESKTKVNNTFSNALKGKASGQYITLDDISPVEHNLGVKVESKDTTLMTYGKNLFDYDPSNTGGNATVLEQTENGVIVQGIVGAEPGIQNYSNGWYGFTMNEKVVRGVPYVVSCDFTFIEDPYRPDTLNTVANKIRLQIEAVGVGTPNSSNSSLQAFRPEVGVKQRLYRTFVPDCDVVKIFVPTCSGTIKVENFMLAVGTTEGVATEYEPYSKDSAEYTPNEDGTVEGVTSISPNMTLVPNTGVMIAECEYNRDINKAFAKLEQLLLNNI